MGSDSSSPADETSNPNITNDTNDGSRCPHSDRKALPACWDCAEEGDIGRGAPAASPTWESFKKFRKSLRFRDKHPHSASSSMTSTVIGSQSSAPEVHPPEEGIEVGSPDIRKSQPGLIVVSGPRIVSLSDKFRTGKSWDREMNQKIAVGDGTPTIWGLRRRTFWVVLACVLLVFVGVVIGVAVGLTKRNHAVHSTPVTMSQGGGNQVSSSSLLLPSLTTETVSAFKTSELPLLASSELVTIATSLQPVTTPSLPSETSTPTVEAKTEPTPPVIVTKPTPTTADPTPSQPTAAAPPTTTTATSTPTTEPTSGGSSKPKCLADDGSTYTDPKTGDQFKVECNVAHQGADIENLEAQTMQECVSLCANNEQCNGAIWYDVGPQGTDLNYCWLKSAMKDDLRYTTDAQSVVRI
ncbi:Uu.00g061630.m01.CDS01 [Anthostomella pinea]|uniref:Uu.00g061630.m01.CDS01 n=1 Tax=Anthostomella pinea TaxID=933095 RepID=A0AAI8YMF8_9PEZI|nr:Uu.00g061630.m01.CDS01 [Anthostomella pinea]